MKAYPILRLTIFLAAGIFLAECLPVETGVCPVVAMLVLLLGMGVLIGKPAYRWAFGVCASLFMVAAGVTLTEHAWKRVRVEWSPAKQSCHAVVQEPPREKARTLQCRVSLAGKEVLLYLPKDSLSASLTVGDSLSFRARIQSPQRLNGASGFDYARYLYRKGISGTAYVAPGEWQKAGGATHRTWKQEALLLRERWLEAYRQWGIGEQELPVLAALTLGCKGDLDGETREAYSAAGLSHVLALSGLHIGIVWLLLNGVSGFLRRRGAWVRWLVVTGVLWAFAFVVGLEASVVRAVIMCMCMELGRLGGARPMSVNTLATAALFMLLVQPFYLFDVGFQLSFVAVLSILLFYPLLVARVPVENRFGRFLWGTVAVTLSAQIGTSPLVMHYFGEVSACSLLTNLVAAVLVPLIIYLTVLAFLASPVPLLQGGVVEALDGCVLALNRTAEGVGGWPFATFSVEHWQAVEVCALYVTLALCWAYAKTRRRKWVIGILASIVCLLALRLAALWGW